MSNTDGPAVLRRVADKSGELNGGFDIRIELIELASAWQAERQAYRSAIEEADRLRFAAEAQAAADRAALEQARAALSECRAALYGAREIVGNIGNIGHAIDLADAAL